ncbi:MAG: NADP-dependent isocitrate dehydrogenase, partial [Eubacteriales bacterium]|nr:NADP-dependent isocitrate dehydrogenase [Eubacteriales bacterium]
AWAGALKKRGELDGNTELVSFAEKLGRAGIEVFEEGYLSEDLAALCDPTEFREMPDNERLMSLIREKLTEMMQG